nr:hypothetical protein [Tanacetum cinerariifolium]
ELVVKYKAEKVGYEEMVKMPLVDLKVLEDESFRMCIDYHKLSKIDLYSGCHKMRVHEDSERTFRTLENMFRACVRNLLVVGILTFREAETGESKMIGLELEQEMTKVFVIKERLEEAKDRQEIKT